MLENIVIQQAIKALSQDVFKVIDSENWEHVAIVQDDRLAALKRILLQAEKTLPAEDMRECIALVKQEDEIIKQRVIAEQQALKQQQAQRQKNRRAISKYQNSPQE